MLHPHPEVPQIKFSEPLAGAVLISPWVQFNPDEGSVKRNQNSDYVTPAAAKRWSSLFLGISLTHPGLLFPFTDLRRTGNKPLDNYNQPLNAEVDWFSGLDSKVKDIFIWGGGGEVLIDSIDAFTKKLQQAHPRVEYVVQPGASHEDFIINKLLGYKDKEEGTKVIESWVAQRL